MAARAKKILQEEGSHRVHGEAWAKRLCRGDQRDASCAAEETWEQASRWLGPDDDPAYAAALEAGEIKQTAAHQRELIRDWLTALLAGEGVSISLPSPSDWDAGTRERAGGRHDLPVLLVARVERVAQWGGQIITAQWKCRRCNSYFEAVREDFDEPAGTLPPIG